MKYIFFALFAISLTFCKSKNLDSKKDFITMVSDTSDFNLRKDKNFILNLSQMDKGVDSFELRLWSSWGGTDLKFITVLKYSNSRWLLTKTRYWTRIASNYPEKDLLLLDSSFTKQILPQASFTNIIDSISNFNIYQLPSQNEIPGFIDNTADGVDYTIEIATKKYYKLLNYHNPQHYKDSIHNKVNRILKFFGENLSSFVSD